MTAWADRYVGIPFKDLGRDERGLDCWGLVRLVFLREFGRELPDCSGYLLAGRGSGEEARRAIAAFQRVYHSVMGVFSEVPPGHEREKDVISCTLSGEESHVGVVLRRGYMLHARRGVGVVVESYLGPKWGNRVKGFYRVRG